VKSTRLAAILAGMGAAGKPVYLLGGDDEFAIKEAATALAPKLAPQDAGEFGTEIIEGGAGNADEALKELNRLRESLQTVGFFAAAKLVWWKNTNLLAAEPPGGKATTEALNELADELQARWPDGVTLLVSAIGTDKRRTLFQRLSKIGEVQFFDAPEAGKADDEADLADFIAGKLKKEGKQFGTGAQAAFRELVEPTRRELANELEKLCLYVGKRAEITAADVRAICSATRTAIIWDLVDAVSARHAPRALAALRNLLDNGEEPIGVVMLLVGQFRLILIARDYADRKILVAGNDKWGFINAYKALPAKETAHLPLSKEGKPPNEWRFQRCAVAACNFTMPELIHALDLLLEANLQLVSTQLDERLVLEELIAKICRRPAATKAT
jgi:DNA polymerase-3 subunit delta